MLDVLVDNKSICLQDGWDSNLFKTNLVFKEEYTTKEVLAKIVKPVYGMVTSVHGCTMGAGSLSDRVSLSQAKKLYEEKEEYSTYRYVFITLVVHVCISNRM